jgi:predicted ATP-binding protein involved in virulence
MFTGKIKYIHIYGLWGVKDIKTSFNPDVNIFIGANGTNKTIFLSLLEAALTADVKTLASVEFSRIVLLIDVEVERIEIMQIQKEESVEIQYKVGDEIFEIQSFFLRARRMGRYEELPLFRLRKVLEGLVNISWLSVNRDNVDTQYIDTREMLDKLKNMVDFKIEELVKQLGMYQLQLESEANTISNDFKKEVMSMMLYDENMDGISNEIKFNYSLQDTDGLKNQLYKAFSAMGVAKDKKDAIEMHVSKIREVLDKVSNQGPHVELRDIFILALLRRTVAIIEISQKHEEQTKQLFTSLNNFWKCLARFMQNKHFEYSKEKGDLLVMLKEGNRTDVLIPLKALSSGEKQLFILLTEALLQRESNYLFIADEPELSLHIKWQKKILPEMLLINPNAQVIVATHSPEVASNYPDKIINMANITSYNE